MINIDKLIWPDSTRFSIKEYSTEQWLGIVEPVLEKLHIFLKMSIEHEELENNVDDGFCIDIWSPNYLLGPLALSWKGILGGQILDEGCRIHISAILFLYCNKKKLITKEEDSFLEFVYEENSGKGEWKLNGWFEDEYQEYEFFDQDDVLRDEVL
ncbi:hypothetical protein PN36_19575 [Candidatus Thiomargarita nelsonii]|uniref:Uncharacterized protein n=1 Tax=Candidatus Thiomargarita nelsonii TaxID=1003181 RepID=A0A4E0QPY7_9GAMM|nr:hypothetical protein PN36_19575 [Candidatus Thiomargarita nelsonii]